MFLVPFGGSCNLAIDLASLTVCLGFYREGSLIDVDRLNAIYKRRKNALLRIFRVLTHRLPWTDLNSRKDIIRASGEEGIFVESLEKEDLELKRDNPIIAALIVYRRVRSEVIDLEKMLRALHPDNRIHARYNPARRWYWTYV